MATPKIGSAPLKWHGGKGYLAPKIIALMPRHVHYVEPYFGGGAVLLHRDPADKSMWLPPHKGVSEVVNDLNGELMNFWRVLQHPHMFNKFQRLMQGTPFAEPEWIKAALMLGEKELVDDLNRARYFFVACRQSMSGRMKDFTPLTRRRVRAKMNEQASAWLSAVEGLPAVHERLKGVVILNRDALDVIRQQDGPDTLFYLDPPYLHETRATTGEYEHEMDEEAHNSLLCRLSDIQGKFILSGYRSALYDAWAKNFRWHRIDVDIPNNAAAGKKKRRMTECLWLNYKPRSR
jgi:DNA adenine methylase